MARSEARIYVTIWDDPDFKALPSSAQGRYFFLISQKDLAHTGVLPLRERRWARSSCDADTGTVAADLKALAAASFVIIDDDTEELFVRSLFRRDKIYRQPNVLLAAVDQVQQIESATIRSALLVEVLRVVDEVPKGSQVGYAKMLAALGATSTPLPWTHGEGVPEGRPEGSAEPIGKGSGNPTENPSPDPSGNPARTPPGERGVVTASSSASPSPDPLSPAPEEAASPPPARADKPRDDRRGTRLPDDFQVTPSMREWASQHVPELAGQGETEKFIDYWRGIPGAKGRKTDWVGTWRNWMRKAANDLKDRQQRAAPRQLPSSNAPVNRPAAERCVRHTSEPAATCGPCRSENIAARRGAQ